MHDYGFRIPALRLVYSYLKNREQRTSFWEEIFFAVRQEYILEPFLFNIYLCDLFYIMSDKDFASYTDNNTPYVSTILSMKL